LFLSKQADCSLETRRTLADAPLDVGVGEPFRSKMMSQMLGGDPFAQKIRWLADTLDDQQVGR
jgi:hypothetical protein